MFYSYFHSVIHIRNLLDECNNLNFNCFSNNILCRFLLFLKLQWRLFNVTENLLLLSWIKQDHIWLQLKLQTFSISCTLCNRQQHEVKRFFSRKKKQLTDSVCEVEGQRKALVCMHHLTIMMEHQRWNVNKAYCPKDLHRCLQARNHYCLTTIITGLMIPFSMKTMEGNFHT